MNATRKKYADGFAIVRDDGPQGAVYLTGRGFTDEWTPDGSEARVFVTSNLARMWIRTRPLGYWLCNEAGRPRVISARAAGVTR